MRAWNKSPTPFAWTDPADAIIKSHRRMLKRISTADHVVLTRYVRQTSGSM
jgi:hypothetical protein